MLYKVCRRYVRYVQSYHRSGDGSLEVWISGDGQIEPGIGHASVRTLLNGDLAWRGKEKGPDLERSPKECWIHSMYSTNLLPL